MQQRTLGDRTVGAIGLGAMPLSVEGRPDEEQAVRTVHAALDAGVTLIDTADAYCLGHSEVGHNERLLARALASWSGDRDAVLVATKGGHTRPPDDSWALTLYASAVSMSRTPASSAAWTVRIARARSGRPASDKGIAPRPIADTSTPPTVRRSMRVSYPTAGRSDEGIR